MRSRTKERDSADKSFDRTAFAKEAGIKSDSVG